MPRVHSAVPGVAWPAITEPVAASLLGMLRQLEESEREPAQQLRQRQFEQLCLLFDHARHNVPWYRDHPGVTDRISCWEDFYRLPVTTRFDLQHGGARLRSVAPPPEHGSLIPFATSGSLGTPLQGVETEVNHFFWNALNLREHLWQGRDLSRRFGAIRTRVEEARLLDWGDPVARLFQTGDAVTFNIGRPITEQAQWLLRHRPDYLLTHPSNLLALTRHFQQRGEALALTGLVTFGEALSPAVRSLCSEVFRAQIADIYSAEEVGYIAVQCERRDGYHLMSENLIVELLDPSGLPCRPGETGRVVVTTLHNFAQPLIRYDIGDFAEPGKPCPCGRTLPTLRRVAGRRRNMLLRPDGDAHWPSFPGELWLAASRLEQIQLRQQRLDLIMVRYVATRSLSEGERSDLSRRLAASLPFDGELRFERVARLESGGNGKFEDFVCEIATGLHGR